MSKDEPEPPPYSPAEDPPPVIVAHAVHPGTVTNLDHRTRPFVQTITQEPGSSVQVITNVPLFGPNPSTLRCGACEQTVRTIIRKEINPPTHIFAAVFCLMLMWPCVYCIYCTNCGKSFNHYCSNCDAYQGTYQPEIVHK